MVKDVAVSYSPIDGKLARTIGVLLARPGKLLDAYRSGAGSLYVTPLKLFVAATALFLAVLNFTATNFYQYTWKAEPGASLVVTVEEGGTWVYVEGAQEVERWLQPRVEPAVDPEIIAALETAAEAATTATDRNAIRFWIVSIAEEERIAARLSEWLPNILWLLMPLFALGLAPLFGRRRLFLEHVIFAMWAHAIVFLLAMGIAALNSRGGNVSAGWILIPYLAYFTVAARSYYAVGWWPAAWRAVVHTIGYTLFVLIPAALIIEATVTDWSTYLAWITT